MSTDELKDEGAQSGYAEAQHWCPHVRSNVQPIDLSEHDESLDPNHTVCSRCPNQNENWFCLQCQAIFCGRFAQGHMVAHYESTGHCVAAGLSDLSFWCYKCESYLYHRTIPKLYAAYAMLTMLKFHEAPVDPPLDSAEPTATIAEGEEEEGEEEKDQRMETSRTAAAAAAGAAPSRSSSELEPYSPLEGDDAASSASSSAAPSRAASSAAASAAAPSVAGSDAVGSGASASSVLVPLAGLSPLQMAHPLINKILGVLYGGALGDAAGLATEFCLSSSSLLPRPDGTIVAARDIRAGDTLCGEEGRVVTVEHVDHLSSSIMYRLQLPHSSYEVTPAHLLTLHWSSGPCVTCSSSTAVTVIWWQPVAGSVPVKRVRSWQFQLSGGSASSSTSSSVQLLQDTYPSDADDSDFAPDTDSSSDSETEEEPASSSAAAAAAASSIRVKYRTVVDNDGELLHYARDCEVCGTTLTNSNPAHLSKALYKHAQKTGCKPVAPTLEAISEAEDSDTDDESAPRGKDGRRLQTRLYPDALAAVLRAKRWLQKHASDPVNAGCAPYSSVRRPSATSNKTPSVEAYFRPVGTKKYISFRCFRYATAAHSARGDVVVASSMAELLQRTRAVFFADTPRSEYLLAGDVLEVPASVLFDARASLVHLISPVVRQRMTAVPPTAVECGAVDGAGTVGDGTMLALQAAASSAAPIAAMHGHVVCESYTHWVTGPATTAELSCSYRRVVAGDPSARVVYMLHNTLQECPFLNARGSVAFTFRQLANAWSLLGVALSADARMMVTELNPISAATGVIDSRSSEFDEPCHQNMLATLHSGTQLVIAFGMYTRARWREAGKLPGVSSVVGTMENGLEITSLLFAGRSVRVLHSPHPCVWRKFRDVARAIAVAHGCSQQAWQLAVNREPACKPIVRMTKLVFRPLQAGAQTSSAAATASSLQAIDTELVRRSLTWHPQVALAAGQLLHFPSDANLAAWKAAVRATRRLDRTEPAGLSDEPVEQIEALLAAVRLTEDAGETVPAAPRVEAADVETIDGESASVVNIVIAGANKRYTLANGVLTHNSDRASVSHLYGAAYDPATGAGAIPFPHTKKTRHSARWDHGDWTDDTDQLILIMETILESYAGASKFAVDSTPSPELFAAKLHSWVRRGFPELGDHGGMGLGALTSQVVGHRAFLSSPHKAAEAVWVAGGRKAAANGGVMRTAVTGVFDYMHADRVVANTKAMCAVTHADPRCTASCVLIALLISRILQGAAIDSAAQTEALVESCVTQTIAAVPALVELGHEAAFREYVGLSRSLSDLKLDDPPAIGFTLKCMGSGLWGLRSTESFATTITRLSREAGDADTNGAVCGAMLGARGGYDSLPAAWLQALPNKAWMDAKVVALIKLMFERYERENKTGAAAGAGAAASSSAAAATPSK